MSISKIMSISVKINAGIITIQAITIRDHKNAVKNTVILFPSNCDVT